MDHFEKIFTIIHHNIFINNGATVQAYDEGTDNIWYDIETNEGNYWSEWSGTGEYLIDGSSGSIDPYPLGEAFIPELYSPPLYSFIVIISLLGLGLAINKRR